MEKPAYKRVLLKISGEAEAVHKAARTLEGLLAVASNGIKNGKHWSLLWIICKHSLAGTCYGCLEGITNYPHSIQSYECSITHPFHICRNFWRNHIEYDYR